MKSVLDIEVSCFKSYSGKEPKSVNLLTWLKSNKYKEKILQLRQLEDKTGRDKIKATLPAITPSGIFNPSRKEEYLVKHSKLICIDIDQKGNEHISNFSELKQELFKIKNVAYAGLSASGNGFFLIMPIAYPKRHKLHFKAIQNDLTAYGIIIDAAPQNVASLRGYSCDKNALFRHDAIPYQRWASNQKPKSIKKYRDKNIPVSQCANNTKAKVEAIIQHIVYNRIDITAYEPDWFRIACALANEFGEEGRDYFHQVSKFYSDYNWKEADNKFNHALNKKYKSISIATFFEKMLNQSLKIL